MLLGEPEEANRQADLAIKHRPDWDKAHLRKVEKESSFGARKEKLVSPQVTALISLGQPDEADEILDSGI